MMIECCGVTIRQLRCPYCGKEHKPKKEKSIGDRIKEWDNSLDNSISAFNRIFDEIQGGDQTDLLEINELYTCNGRMVTRHYSDGISRTYPFLFDDENDTEQGRDSSVAWDTFDKNGRFLHTYRGISTIARDLGMNASHLSKIIRGDGLNTTGLIIKQRKLC